MALSQHGRCRIYSLLIEGKLSQKSGELVNSLRLKASEASKEVMSLKDLNGDQREVSNISCCIGLGDHWDHT